MWLYEDSKKGLTDFLINYREQYIREQLDKRLGRAKQIDEAEKIKSTKADDLYAIPKALQVCIDFLLQSLPPLPTICIQALYFTLSEWRLH